MNNQQYPDGTEFDVSVHIKHSRHLSSHGVHRVKTIQDAHRLKTETERQYEVCEIKITPVLPKADCDTEALTLDDIIKRGYPND